jgi:type III secretion system YscQ/HrcQ family protein
MIPAVSAFPYRRWPRVSRAEATLLRRVLRAFEGEALQRAQAEAETLLGLPLRIVPGAARLLPAAEALAALAAPQVVLWLERRSTARVLPIAVELAPELGAHLIDRVLGGDGQPGHVPGEPLDDLSLGVLAYLAARAAAAAGGSLQVRGVLERETAAGVFGDARVLAWPFALQLDGRDRGDVRVFAGEEGAALFAHGAAEERPRRVPDALAAVPVTLCAHAARVTLLRSELATLARGDVVIPERCALARDGRGFAGRVELHTIGARGGFVCSARGSELAIERLDLSGDMTMSEGKRIETQALELDPGGEALRAAADAPIELCLELARFTLPLGELSALRAGEVLSTGRAIGEVVTLSAGGRAFARGELCEVDGQIGVRIAELI